MTKSLLEKKLTLCKDRELKYLDADKSAVRAIAQAAINVELFTIPLYMVALYSIKGTHPINAKNINYYKGRLWPGSATTANPSTVNEKVFNCVFSIFVEEMLHLQMAANLAQVIGVQPKFTSLKLQKPDHSWICYGNDKTVIPHIIDFQDTDETYHDVKVKLDSLNAEQIKLFLAIEQTEEDARTHILQDKENCYFPHPPFADWKPSYTEENLKPFGTIGWLYNCYAHYLSIKYTDNECLWDKILKEQCEKWKEKNLPEDFILQKDMFNSRSSGHPAVEYPCFATELAIKLKQKENGQLDKTDIDFAFDQAIEMMSAITDQGEGSTLDHKGLLTDNASGYEKTLGLSQWKRITPPLLEIIKVSAESKSKCPAHVKAKYQAYKTALEYNYPAYTDTGDPAPSGDAKARSSHSEKTHYERFEKVKELISDHKFVTWDTWHKDPKHIWTPDMLRTKDREPSPSTPIIPTPEDVAGALNRLKQDDSDNKNYKLLSQAAVGAIAGITTVLDQYWQNPTVDFPYPSMVGSGDRVAIGWAIFGKAPDLSRGMKERELGAFYHACQGLDLKKPDSTREAPVQAFHSCRGSNQCKAEGGCGFVQQESGGGLCSAMRVAYPTVLKGGEVSSELVEGKVRFSAPGDNKCSGSGGCAVPISASQLFPRGGKMKIYKFEGHGDSPEPFEEIDFEKGENVYDKAWEVYCQVIQKRTGKRPDKPPTRSDLRVALPPST